MDLRQQTPNKDFVGIISGLCFCVTGLLFSKVQLLSFGNQEQIFFEKHTRQLCKDGESEWHFFTCGISYKLHFDPCLSSFCWQQYLAEFANSIMKLGCLLTFWQDLVAPKWHYLHDQMTDQGVCLVCAQCLLVCVPVIVGCTCSVFMCVSMCACASMWAYTHVQVIISMLVHWSHYFWLWTHISGFLNDLYWNDSYLLFLTVLDPPPTQVSHWFNLNTRFCRTLTF